MSVTMLSILLVLSSVGAGASSLLSHLGRWADVRLLSQEPPLAADEGLSDEAPQSDAAQGEIRSVLRSLRRISEPPISLPAAPPAREAGLAAPRPLPVAPALECSLPIPAPIWPSVRFFTGPAAATAVAVAPSQHPRPTKSESVSGPAPRLQIQAVHPAQTIAGRPRLTLSCQAPDAVDSGSQVRYKLVIRNTGDGVAEQVVVEPQILAGCGNQPPGVKRFLAGDLPPGESCEITLRDLARDAPSLQVRFFATDRNGSEASADARVAVRRPAVEISLDGPGQITRGDHAVFEIRAVNAGAGAAESVRVRCSAGEGLRLTVLDQQVQFAAHQGQLTWAIGRLAAGESKVLRLKARPATAGEHRMRVAIESESDDVGKLPRPAAAEKTITVRDRAVDERTASWQR